MRNVDLFDDYLFGRLNASENSELESRLKAEEAFENEFKAHQSFIESLQHATIKIELKKKLKAMHAEEFGNSNIVSINQPKYNYWKIVAVAACVSLLVFVGGALIFRVVYFSGTKDFETEMKKQVVSRIKAFEAGLKIGQKKQAQIAPANVEATGFSINAKGYFLTSLHAVKNSDSVLVQNDLLDYVSAERVWEDKKLDVAIFKLKNPENIKNIEPQISFRFGNIDLGEKVFALGYPRETIVYSEGNISASSGVEGDTTKFQLSLLVNPGNSGSPVLDDQGNLIGIISGRNNNAQGVSYAVKAQYIYDMIKNIPDKTLRDDLLPKVKNRIRNLKRTEQVKKLSPFVYNIMIYNSNAEN